MKIREIIRIIKESRELEWFAMLSVAGILSAFALLIFYVIISI